MEHPINAGPESDAVTLGRAGYLCPPGLSAESEWSTNPSRSSQREDCREHTEARVAGGQKGSPTASLGCPRKLHRGRSLGTGPW